jgi:hypothetical protein
LSSTLHYLQQQSAGSTCDKRGNKEFTQPRKEWETRGPGVEAIFPSGIFLSSDHFVCFAATLFEVHTWLAGRPNVGLDEVLSKETVIGYSLKPEKR